MLVTSDEATKTITLTVNQPSNLDLTVESTFEVTREITEADGTKSTVFTITADSHIHASQFMGTMKKDQKVIAYLFIILRGINFFHTFVPQIVSKLESIDDNVRNSMSPKTLKVLMDHLYSYIRALDNNNDGYAHLSVKADGDFSYSFYKDYAGIPKQIFNLPERYCNLKFITVKDHGQQRHYLLNFPQAIDILKLVKVLEWDQQRKPFEKVLGFAHQVFNESSVDGYLTQYLSEIDALMLIDHRIARNSQGYSPVGITAVTLTKSGGSASYEFKYALKKMTRNSWNVKVFQPNTLLERKTWGSKKNSIYIKSKRTLKSVGELINGEFAITDPQSPFIAVEAETENPSEFTLIFVGMMPAHIAKLSKAIDSFKMGSNLDQAFEHFRAAFDTSATPVSIRASDI